MAQTNATTTLLTEHLRYTPLSLLDDIINVTNETLYRVISAVEAGLLSCGPRLLGFDQKRLAHPDLVPSPNASFGSSLETPESTFHPDLASFPEAKAEIETGLHQLETFLEATVDRNFDKVEIYVLRNILSVPAELLRWVKLKHYEGLEFNEASQVDVEELYTLRRKLRETERLRSALLAERERGAHALSQVRDLLHGTGSTTQGASDMSWFLRNGGLKDFQAEVKSAKNGGALSEKTKSAVARLPELKRLLATLRPHIAGELKPPPLSAEAEERREYIEGQVRRTLESQGVDVASGEGHGGSSSASHSLAAQNLSREDVEAMEGLEKSLGLKGDRRES